MRRRPSRAFGHVLRPLSHLAALAAILRGFRLPLRAISWLVTRSLEEPVLVERRRDPMRFLVRTRVELLILKEVALDHEYERIGEPLEDGWTVLDVGAGPGEFAVDAALRLPGCTVHAFEPSPQAFALLERNIALNGLHNVTPHACAAARASGTVTLDARSPYTSLHAELPSDAPMSNGSTRVAARSLDALVHELGLERIDYLKVDCEGCEYGALGGASAETLARIRRICIELHDVDGERDEELAARLVATGYSIRRRPGPAWTETGWLYASRSVAA